MADNCGKVKWKKEEEKTITVNISCIIFCADGYSGVSYEKVSCHFVEIEFYFSWFCYFQTQIVYLCDLLPS